MLLPSPPWGRGWLASGVFTSRGGPGEGVLPTVNSYVGHHTSWRGFRAKTMVYAAPTNLLTSVYILQ
jgi:hypothetical protein